MIVNYKKAKMQQQLNGNGKQKDKRQCINNYCEQYMRQSIELQDKYQCENLLILPEHEPRIKYQTTTKCSFIPTPQIDFQSCIVSSTDLSFQVEMHRENVETIKQAANMYLQECLLGGYSKELGFKDQNLYLYKQHHSDVKQGCVLDVIISQNELLNDDMKKQINLILQEEDGLTRFLRQIPQAFGITVGKQLVFLIYRILNQKHKKYKEFFKRQPSIVPKFNCFIYYDNDDLSKQLHSSSPVYEEIDLDQVISFSQKDMQQIANRLYFTNMKILNLKCITAECNPRANIYKQFAILIKKISKLIFLTFAGATQPQRNNCSFFDIPRDISFTQFSEVGLSIQKSLSRASVPFEDEQGYDFISKRIKFY